MAIHRANDPADLLEQDENEPLDGRNTPSLGPSDSSDTGADLIGLAPVGAALPDLPADLGGVDAGFDASDRNGTGERASAGTEEVLEAADIGFDRVVSADEAGLGSGLDQAEEALLGITDEELESLASDP